MSMNKLSTELDCKIARYLIGDNKTLGAFSRVSRYYRRVVEPILYEVLNVSEDEIHFLQWLLLTLMDRPDLASKIITISMLQRAPRFWSSDFQCRLDGRWFAQSEKMRNKIYEVMKSTTRENENNIQVYWHLDSMAKGLNQRDAALALILCLAPNLSILRVSDNLNLGRTMVVLSRLCRESEAGPFMRLKELSMHDYVRGNRFFGLPPIESIVVENIRETWGKWTSIYQIVALPGWEPFFFTKTAVASLRSIVFVGIEHATPKAFTKMISSPFLANVTQLVIKSCGIYFERTGQFDDNFDMPALVRALEQYVPNLEHFEFTRALPGIESLQFDDFLNLKKLRTLAVSLNTITRQEDIDWEVFFGCHNVFPESLEYLTLENFKVDQLNELIQQFHADFGETDDPYEACLSFFESVAPKFQLKGLAIAVDMDMYGPEHHTGVLELDPEDVAFFRDMADMLVTAGVNFEVFCASGPSNLFYKLLVKPGWTAPRPHSLSRPKMTGDRYTALADTELVWDL